MPTFVPITINELRTPVEKPSRTYALDLDRGRILGMTDNLRAVEQAIRKALITPRWKCLIYDNQYGSELKSEIMAKDASRQLMETEIPRMAEDCLLPDSRILSVRDFTVSFEGDSCLITFYADTIFGEVYIQEAI